MSTVSVLPDWLTVREAAEEILGVTPQRVHQLIRTYGIETRQPSPRLMLVKRTDIERVAEQERPTGVHLDHQEPRNGRRRRRT